MPSSISLPARLELELIGLDMVEKISAILTWVCVHLVIKSLIINWKEAPGPYPHVQARNTHQGAGRGCQGT